MIYGTETSIVKDITQLLAMLFVPLALWISGYISQRPVDNQSHVVRVPNVIALMCGNPRKDSTIDLKYGSQQIVSLLSAVVSIITVCLKIDFHTRAVIFGVVLFGIFLIWAIVVTLDSWLLRRKGDRHSLD
jgi:hypothetical protein